MNASSQLAHKWRRFNHKHGAQILIWLFVAVVLLVVGFLMYVLTSLNWRSHW